MLGELLRKATVALRSVTGCEKTYVMLFAAMALVLVLRPYGLLGTAGRE